MIVFSLPQLLLAIVLDYFFAEPPANYHPLVYFGRQAERCERYCRSLAIPQWLQGLLAWTIMVLVPVLLCIFMLSILPSWLGWLLAAALLYLSIAFSSLKHHAQAVAIPLQGGDLPAARQALAMIVSRDTQQLSEQQVCKATIESVLENGSDGIFAAIFWFLLLGAPGVVLYRLSNTLDAMWGYKTADYRAFGKPAARIDDALNFIPARLTAVSYALVGNFSNAVKCMRNQGSSTESPNAGVVMAAGAGALNLTLGGAAQYHGEAKARPILGEGRAPIAADIDAALKLVRNAVILWVIVVAVLWLG